MRGIRTHRRLIAAGRAWRSIAWLLVVALLFQLPFGTAVATRMWSAPGSLHLAGDPCAGHSGGQDQHPGQSSHDHQQCLLCNVGLGTGTLPVLALVSAPVAEPATPAPLPQQPIVRKDVHAAEPRGPPRLA